MNVAFVKMELSVVWKWEGFRSHGVENAHNITRDASSKFVGGAERAGCESLLVKLM